MSYYSNYSILYGNFCLSNKRYQVTDLTFRTSSPLELQTMALARTTGTAVVRTRDAARTVAISGGIVGVGSQSGKYYIHTIQETFKAALRSPNRYLRLCPNDFRTVLDSCQATTGWTASNDAANISLDQDEFFNINSSVKFDIDVSASANNQATLAKTLSTPVDLSASTDRGSFNVAIYISDVYYVTSIDLRVGNDTSNYYSATVTTNYEGKAFENGWNYLSVQWGNAVQGKVITEVGTVTDSAIDYLYCNINYSASMVDSTGRLGGFWHENEDYVRNVPCYLDGDVTFGGEFWNDNNQTPVYEFSANLLNYKGWEISSHPKILFNITGITTVSSTQKVDLKGNFTPLIRNQFTLNTVTNLTDLRYYNLTTGENIRWTKTWAAGDVLVFDGLETTVTTNGLPQDFEGKLPKNQLGNNWLQMQVVTGSSTTVSQLTSDSTASTLYNAQSFLAVAGTLISLTVYAQTGALGGDTTLYIYSDNAGSPGSLLWTGTANSSTSDTKTYIPNLTVTATTYWIIARCYNGGFGDFFQWNYKASTNPYANGQRKTSSDLSSWTSLANDDMKFSVTIEPTPLTNIDWNCSYYEIYN